MENIIIGATLNGLLNAYYLNKLGANVTIIDKQLDFTPLEHYSALLCFRDDLLFNFSCPMPKLLSSIFTGKDKFTQSFGLKTPFDISNPSQKSREKTRILLKKCTDFSLKEYEKLALNEDFKDTIIKKNGYFLFKDDDGFLKQKIQNNPNILENEQLDENIKKLDLKLFGALKIPHVLSLNYAKFTQALKLKLEENGVKFICDEIVSFEKSNKKITKAMGKKTSYEADFFILATNSKVHLLREFEDLPLVPVKSCSVNFDTKSKLDLSALIFEKFGFSMIKNEQNITLTSQTKRFPNDGFIDFKLCNQMLESFKNISKIDISEAKYSAKIRLESKSGLPYFGRCKSHPNLIFSLALGSLDENIAPFLAQKIATILSKDLQNTHEDLLLYSALWTD